MFTLEESAHLGFMLRVVAWTAIIVLVGGSCYGGVRWMHAHHHALTAVHRA
ncbi:MAG TPA: hypothetical protein VL225_13330 [Vicinamibacterales bacterium]|jgi:hypothetical protein|nr:hypothetical protein [Vicinamibacterales bacterium]